MGCRMNTEEYIHIYYLKIVNQQVKCRALEMTSGLHNKNSHGQPISSSKHNTA